MPVKITASKRKAVDTATPVANKKQALYDSDTPPLTQLTPQYSPKTPLALDKSSNEPARPSSPMLEYNTNQARDAKETDKSAPTGTMVSTNGKIQFNMNDEDVEKSVVPMFMPSYQNIKPEDFASDKANAPLWKLNAHMNVFFPSLYFPDQKSKIKVSKKETKNNNDQLKTYINIYNMDRSRPQALVSFLNVNLIQFTVMSPFAATRWPSPFPYGTHRDRWNDPDSTEGAKKAANLRVKKQDSTFSFEITDRAIDNNSASNRLMSDWLDYMEHLDSLMMYTVAMQLEELFPVHYAALCAKVVEKGQAVTPERVALMMKQNAWRGLVNRDKNGVRKIKIIQQVFRYANAVEKAVIDMPDYECQSGEPELTKWIKKSLTYEDMDGKPMGARWEADIPVFRCRSKQERETSCPEQLFEQLSYKEAGMVISTDSNVIATVFSLKLTCDASVIYLKGDVKAYIWLGAAPKYSGNNSNNFELPNPMDINFDSAFDPSSGSTLLLE